MSKTTQNVIGEGSFGCIHKPSLVCRDKKIPYKNKISKLLLTENAIQELKEYMLISETDKKSEYFLGMPQLCKLKISKNSIKSIKKCNRLSRKNTINKKLLENYSLLIMNDGGMDVEKFGLECGKLTISETNKKTAIDFWKETGRLLQGLAIFQKHDIVHFDLKPQNIVYDSKNKRINFIDFGHMRKISDSIKSAEQSDNGLIEDAFWNYPFEVQFLNKDKYLKISNMTNGDRKKWMRSFLMDLDLHNDTEFATAYETFIDLFTENLSTVEIQKIEQKYKYDFYKTLIQQIHKENYQSFLEKSIKTVDIYGIGMTFKYALNYTSHLLPTKFIEKMSELSYLMTTADLSKRVLVDNAIRLHLEAISLLR